MGWGAIASVLGAAGAGHARGKVARQAIDREELQQALLEHHRQSADRRADRQLDFENKRLTAAEQDRRDLLKFRIEDAGERGKDRDADREERRESHRQQSLDRGEARAARKEARELRPDERESAAGEFAYGMVTAAGGDPRVAQDYGARDMATARKLGLRRDHYYAAADRYKHRDVAKSKATETDTELEGGAPATTPAKPALPPLSADDRAKAAKDPGFKAYLKRRGYDL